MRESERIYRAIGESIDFGVWTADADGRNTYTSDSFLRLTGLTQDRCAGDGWRSVVHPEDAPALQARWSECLRSGEQLDHEFRVLGADGRKLSFKAQVLLMTPKEVEYFRHGGILHYVLRQLASRKAA